MTTFFFQEMIITNKRNKKKSAEPLGKFQPKLSQSILLWRGFKFLQMIFLFKICVNVYFDWICFSVDICGPWASCFFFLLKTTCKCQSTCVPVKHPRTDLPILPGFWKDHTHIISVIPESLNRTDIVTSRYSLVCEVSYNHMVSPSYRII